MDQPAGRRGADQEMYVLRCDRHRGVVLNDKALRRPLTRGWPGVSSNDCLRHYAALAPGKDLHWNLFPPRCLPTRLYMSLSSVPNSLTAPLNTGAVSTTAWKRLSAVTTKVFSRIASARYRQS